MEEQDKFYYVSFISACCGGIGHHTIRQRGGNGFNVAGAHKYLLEKFKHVPVITFWQEIPENHHLGFLRYGKWLMEACTGTDKKGPGLHIVKGECEATTPPKGDLKPVPTDDK